MHNPYLAILAAAIDAWVFGSVWYNILAKAWLAALGNDPAQIEAKRNVRQVPYVPMAVSFVSELLMAVVLLWMLRMTAAPDVVGPGYAGRSDLMEGAFFGFLLGGLMALSGLVNNMFAGRTLRLSLIDGTHWIGVAVIECVVLTALS